MSSLSQVRLNYTTAAGESSVVHGVVMTTREGEIGVLSPVTYEDYSVLMLLQKRLVEKLPQNAALNPMNFRWG